MSLKVLVVDDEAGYCAMISRILRYYGFSNHPNETEILPQQDPHGQD